MYISDRRAIKNSYAVDALATPDIGASLIYYYLTR